MSNHTITLSDGAEQGFQIDTYKRNNASEPPSNFTLEDYLNGTLNAQGLQLLEAIQEEAISKFAAQVKEEANSVYSAIVQFYPEQMDGEKRAAFIQDVKNSANKNLNTNLV